MHKKLLVSLMLLVAVFGLVVPVWSNHGPYHPSWQWSTIYHQQAFTAEQAAALGYVPAGECDPGMGYHYLNPAEAEAWFSGKSGGMQVLLFDRNGMLAGVEYMFSAPSLNAPPILGMHGPMEGHVPGMPPHYDQHIYFADPLC